MSPAAIQPALPGVGELPPKKDPKVAFGGFVKPEMYDIFGEHDLNSVMDAEKQWMQPEKLEVILHSPPLDAKNVVDGVSLTSKEHQVLLRARDPEKIAEVAFSGVTKNGDIDDELLAAANRSEVHILEGKRMAMVDYREKLLERRTNIRVLQKEVRAPGFAHKTSIEMRGLINDAWQEFTNMLEVVHIQRGWDDETRERAETTLMHYLTQGSSRDRVGHWNQMLALASVYLSRRQKLFHRRIQSANGALRKRGVA